MAMQPEIIGQPQQYGLEHWMRRVARLSGHAKKKLAAGTVHDLRTALRRCRSIAAGVMEVAPDPAWRKMQRAAKKLFRPLGELRDIQVMVKGVERLSLPDDKLRATLLSVLSEREAAAEDRAAKALDDFDRKRWKNLTHRLPPRVARLPEDGIAFQYLALQQWSEAHELHHAALRSRSRVAYHRLRIAVKRFRYTVENFLPQRHAAIGAELKQVQDLLGEGHDLDVLEPEARKVARAEKVDFEPWRERIAAERAARLKKYLELTRGENSLWERWRRVLPYREIHRTKVVPRRKAG